MKICFITDTYCDVNGVSRFLQDMMQLSHDHDNTLSLITVTKKDACVTFEETHILTPHFAMPIPYYNELDIVLPSYRAIKKKFDAIQPDIIHISTPGLVGLYGRIYAKKRNIPLSGTYHTDFPSYVYKNTKIRLFERIIQKYMNYFYKDFSLLFTRSDEYITNLTQKIKLDPATIVTLQAGTDTRKFTPEYKDTTFHHRYALPPNAKIFLYVGRITAEKNIAFILDIFQQHLQDANAVLLLAGSGDEAYIQKYQSNTIRFLGTKRKKSLWELYANADMFLFPSTTDTLGQVVLEALSSATPVMVSDIGGPKNIVQASEAPVGYVAHTQEQSQWLTVIESVIEEKIDLSTLSHNARAYAKTLDIHASYQDFIAHHQKLWEQYASK